jgi:hypothetical protein
MWLPRGRPKDRNTARRRPFREPARRVLWGTTRYRIRGRMTVESAVALPSLTFQATSRYQRNHRPVPVSESRNRCGRTLGVRADLVFMANGRTVA